MSKLFISYSHVDTPVLERLHAHMAILKEEGKVSTWFDREILAGGDLDSNIKEKLTSADIFIAIVSPDYLNSKYCYQVEFKAALSQMEAGELVIVPVIAEPCDWHASPLGKMKAIPIDGKPISDWVNKNTAYLNIIQEIRRLMDVPPLIKKANLFPQSPDTLQSTRKAYKVKQDFTEVDIVDFRQRTFDAIKKYFNDSIEEINTIADIQARMLDSEKKSFTCLISNRRKTDSKGYITVQISTESHFGRSDLSYTLSDKPSPNVVHMENVFAIEKTDYKLMWVQRSLYNSSSTKVFSENDMAELLWTIFIDQVGISN
jgi:hypothetical protein